MKKVVMLLSNPFRPDPRVFKEAQSLANSGYELTILAWDRTKKYPAVEQILPNLQVIRIQEVQSDFGLGTRQIAPLIRFWQATLPLLNLLNPAIIHCHDFDTLPVGVFFAKRKCIPIIYDAHEHYAEFVRPRLRGLSGSILYNLIDAAEKFFTKQVNAVITVDDHLARKYRSLNSRVIVIGHYPPKEFIQSKRLIFDKPEITLIYNGRLSQDRGTLVYIDIIRRLAQRSILARLILVGEFSPADEKEIALQKMNGLEKQVTFVDWMPYSKIPRLLETSDVGLAIYQPIPRYVNALPVKIFEYMAASLPVIVSDFPPLKKLINDCNCGVIIPPDDVHLAVDVIQGWLKFPDEARLMGTNGWKAVYEKYNWEMLATSLFHLYNNLV